MRIQNRVCYLILLFLLPCTPFLSFSVGKLSLAPGCATREYDFLITTTANYFKSFSRENENEVFSYNDCSVWPANEQELEMGVFMTGWCVSEHGENATTYYVAMDSKANVMHSYFEVIDR